MNSQTHPPVGDRPCPLGFIIAPAFLVTLVWLCTLLSRLAP
jgi:hypothetical protein